MHTFTVRTKYTFDDVVTFDSRMQHLEGTGRIVSITFDKCGDIHYAIEIPRTNSGCTCQPGIYEDEIVLSRANSIACARHHSLTVQTKFGFGERVAFDSRTQSAKGTGEIVFITVEIDRSIHYGVQKDDAADVDDLQLGVYEDELALFDRKG